MRAVRLQEVMRPQLEMIERKVAELREKGQSYAAARLERTSAGDDRVPIARRLPSSNASRPGVALREGSGTCSSRADRPRRPADERPSPNLGRRADLECRLHHLQLAVENLHAAGMPADRRPARAGSPGDPATAAVNRPPRAGQDRGGGEAVQREFRHVHQRLDELNRRLDELAEVLKRAARLNRELAPLDP